MISTIIDRANHALIHHPKKVQIRDLNNNNKLMIPEVFSGYFDSDKDYSHARFTTKTQSGSYEYCV